METDSSTATLLGNRSPREFLDTYWQKRPLVIRNAIPDFHSPLSPEELAGLACDAGVESRLILEQDGADPWELRHGPFQDSDFLDLPATHWTVLVQEVDRLVPKVAQLLDRFRFLPDWRIDDVMISYAPTHGSVGPHIDNYDVFLLQGLGHRRWRIGSEPVENEELVPQLDVRILADFDPDEEFVLGPGDMLYLPPRIAHHGVAEDDDCMTYSIGFRAPRHQSLIGDFLQRTVEGLDPEARYRDPELAPVDHPGEIHEQARAKVRQLLQDLVAADESIDRWLGQYLTRPSRDRAAVSRTDSVSQPSLVDAIRRGTNLRRGPVSELAFIEHEDGTATLFANGDAIDLGEDLAYAARIVTGRQVIPSDTIQPHLDHDAFLNLLSMLVNENLLELDEG